jgi:pyruvate formate lyase activating enzyme
MPLTHGALLKTTLLDYPGEVASVIFTPGCNLRCPYCHNPSLVISTDKNEELLPIEEIKSFLMKRRNLIGAVVISGGEPLIHDNIDDLVHFIKSLGLKVKIDTNGLFPERLKRLDVDYIAMDIKTSPENYYKLGLQGDRNKLLQSIEYIINSGIDHEFRTTVCSEIIDSSDIIKLVPLLKNAQRWLFTPFQPGNTLDPAFNGKESPTEDYINELISIAKDSGIESSIR